MRKLGLGLAAVVALAFVFSSHGLGAQLPIGMLRDDGRYALAARAIAHGLGYVDLSLPAHPPALRYPPGFAALLALVVLGAGSPLAEAARLHWVAPVAGGLWLVLAYLYLARRARPGTALLAAGVVAAQPLTWLMGAWVVAELPFAIMALLAVWLAEGALAAGAGAGAWLGVGLVGALACLVRTAGLAIVGAVAIALALARRPGALAAFVAGNALLLLPWWAYQQATDSAAYVGGWLANLPSSPGMAALVAGTVFVDFFGSALPGTMLAAPFRLAGPPGGFQVALGVGFALVLGRGMWARRALGPQAWVAPLAVATSCLIAAGYALGFAFYAADFMQRALLPVLPLVVLLVAEGLADALAQSLPEARRQPALWAALGLCLLLNGWRTLGDRTPDYAEAMAGPPELMAMLGYVAEHTPPGALCISSYGHLVSFYTGRPCIEFPEALPGARLTPGVAPASVTLAALVREHPAYMVTVPWYVSGDPNDHSAQTIGALLQLDPGLLRPVYQSPSGQLAVLAVDPLALQLWRKRQRP